MKVVARWGTTALLVAATLGAGADAAQAQVSFEQTVTALGNDDPDVRLQAVQALKASALPEAAVPLTRALADPVDRIQLEAIAAELNLFLAERIVPRRRVGLVIEVRNSISALSIFEQGGAALDARPVPVGVLTALRGTVRDDNQRVAVEGLYAFGALAENAYGAERQALLAASAEDLASALAMDAAEVRAAALRVINRVYAWRVGDAAVNERVGDAVIDAMNAREFTIRLAAMDTLGALRFERGIQALTDQFQHYQKGTVAQTALGALARVAHPSSAPVFSAALSSRDLGVKLAAVEGLARIGDVAQAATITTALAKERSDAVQLGGAFAAVLLSDGPFDEIVGALAKDRLRDQAMQYLVDAAPGRARIFSPHAEDPQPRIRTLVVTALGLSGDPDAQSIVERYTKDADPTVARTAARAVARLQGVAATTR